MSFISAFYDKLRSNISAMTGNASTSTLESNGLTEAAVPIYAIKAFAESKDLSAMQAMVNDCTIEDVNAFFHEDLRWTALMYQCYYRHMNIGALERVQFLLNCTPRALPNIQDMNGRTALHFSLNTGKKGGDDPNLIKLLLDNGADCCMKTNDGNTALDIAKYNGFKQSILVICDWYRKKYEDILYVDDSAEIPSNLQPSDSLLEDVLKDVISRGKVLSLLTLLNLKSSYDGFADSLEYGLREELLDSLLLEEL